MSSSTLSQFLLELFCKKKGKILGVLLCVHMYIKYFYVCSLKVSIKSFLYSYIGGNETIHTHTHTPCVPVRITQKKIKSFNFACTFALTNKIKNSSLFLVYLSYKFLHPARACRASDVRSEIRYDRTSISNHVEQNNWAKVFRQYTEREVCIHWEGSMYLECNDIINTPTVPT